MVRRNKRGYLILVPKWVGSDAFPFHYRTKWTSEPDTLARRAKTAILYCLKIVYWLDQCLHTTTSLPIGLHYFASAASLCKTRTGRCVQYWPEDFEFKFEKYTQLSAQKTRVRVFTRSSSTSTRNNQLLVIYDRVNTSLQIPASLNKPLLCDARTRSISASTIVST